MLRSFVLLVAGLASLSAVSVFAQDAALGQKYGNGVHAYYSGDYQKAYEDFTLAINAGSKDPRVFYFRGLAYRVLGRSQEAVMDFQKGAALESKDVSNYYNVGKALERVQGDARVELETYRVNARVAAIQQAETQRKARYEAIQREELRVLREQTLLAEPGKTDSSEPISTPAPAATAPSADADKAATTKADAKADKETEKPEKKAAKKPAAAGDDDLFGGAPEEKKAEKAEKADKAEKAEKKAAKKPAAAGDDDLFGGAAEEKKADKAEKKPAAKKAASKKDDDDPFGG